MRAIAADQRAVDRIYALLDELTEQTRDRLARSLAAQAATPQGPSERDVLVARDTVRLRTFSRRGERLVVGRLDTARDTVYVGRLGLLDADRQVLLVDWRAQAAAAFYRATPARPLGVVTRRHLTVRDRQVVHAVDDLGSHDAPGSVPSPSGSVLVDAVQRPAPDGCTTS